MTEYSSTVSTTDSERIFTDPKMKMDGRRANEIRLHNSKITVNRQLFFVAIIFE